MTMHRCWFCRRTYDTSPCRYCLRYTCATCHHGKDHLRKCPETRRRETSQR